ncbi:MAG: phospholipase D-like domain-containing protein [Bacteroidota bacterium]
MPTIDDKGKWLQPFASLSGRKTTQPQAELRAAAPKPAVDSLVLSNASTHNKVTLHPSPTESNQALLDLIKNAKRSLHIEVFIWHNDENGREIAEAIRDRIQKAKAKGEPFDVKIMVDSTGLRGGSGGSDDAGIIDLLKSYGADAREFNPDFVSWEAKGVPITHRKLFVADGEKFITGGRNIGNEYLHEKYKVNGQDEPSWHDLFFTVEGDETARIEKEFYENWQRIGGEAPKTLPKPVPADGKAKIQSFVTDPHSGTQDIRAAHTQAIRNAKEEIVAIYPYFSDDKLVKELLDAKKRNPSLKVRVLMPANKEASHEGTIYSILNRETADQLMKAGIEVRLFEGDNVNGKTVPRFSHFKGMLIDNKLLSIGSANGDARTYNSNHELVTMISDESTIKNFQERILNPDWKAAKPLTPKDLEGDSFWNRAKRKALEALDPLL